jgi:hypothetical protein
VGAYVGGYGGSPGAYVPPPADGYMGAGDIAGVIGQAIEGAIAPDPWADQQAVPGPGSDQPPY